MDLSSLKPPQGAHRKSKRVGRGTGSGHGKTSGRGHKGLYARAGSKHRAGREGGQMPLVRRLPKRGFVSPFRVEYSAVNIADLAAAQVTEHVDVARLHELKLVRSRRRPVKILGTGTIDRPLHVVAHAFSKSAQEKIIAAGGTCECVAFRRSMDNQPAASVGEGASVGR